MEPNKPDEDRNKQSAPGIPRPGKQVDQQQDPMAPPQPSSRHISPSSSWIPPTTGNPDLDPVNLHQSNRIDLREPNPLVPRGMHFDPRQLIDQQNRGPRNDPSPEGRVPPGARFDPFGPPDPNLVGPGRGPFPGSGIGGIPDPDHFQAPGMPPLDRTQKSLKFPFPRPNFQPPGGPGGPPFL